MTRGRRKLSAIQSDEEAVSLTPKQLKLTPTQIESPVDQSLIGESEVETPVASSKKPRLDGETLTTRPAKAKALSNALWRTAGATSGRAPRKQSEKGRGKRNLQLPVKDKGPSLPDLPHSLANSANTEHESLNGKVPAIQVPVPRRSRIITAQNWHDGSGSDNDTDNSCLDRELESDDPELQAIIGGKKVEGQVGGRFALERPVWNQPDADGNLSQPNLHVAASSMTSGGMTSNISGSVAVRTMFRSIANLPRLDELMAQKTQVKARGSSTQARMMVESENQTRTSHQNINTTNPALVLGDHNDQVVDDVAFLDDQDDAGPPPPPPPTPQLPVQPLWPSYTNLIQNGSREYNLTAQGFEVKLVVRKSFQYLYANLCFVNHYPSSATRVAWTKKALLRAANDMKIVTSRGNNTAAQRYEQIKERLRQDDTYHPILGKLLEARIPIFRNNLKSYVSQAVVPYFDLRPNCAEKVDWLISKMRYIYPCDTMLRRIDSKRPYQCPPIISSISAFYFTRSSDIIRSNQALFKPTEDGYQDEEIPDTMIAAAATSAYGTLAEWRSGYHQQLDFSANAATGVYHAHIALLSHIRSDNPHGYHLLKAKLFKDVQAISQANVSDLPADAVELMDIQNIAVD